MIKHKHKLKVFFSRTQAQNFNFAVIHYHSLPKLRPVSKIVFHFLSAVAIPGMPILGPPIPIGGGIMAP